MKCFPLNSTVTCCEALGFKGEDFMLWSQTHLAATLLVSVLPEECRNIELFWEMTSSKSREGNRLQKCLRSTGLLVKCARDVHIFCREEPCEDASRDVLGFCREEE